MTPDDDPPPPEWLAAYADGELHGPAKARVERWLAADPAARAELQTQRRLSPDNARFWVRADPPAPTAREWAAVRAGIDRGLAEPARRPARRGRMLAAVAAGLLILAGLTWWHTRPPAGAPPAVAQVPTSKSPPPTAADDPLAGFAVLPVASEDDVIIERVAGDRDGSFPVGGHPLPGPLVLARADELVVEGFDPDDDEPEMTPARGDAPLWFAGGR